MTLSVRRFSPALVITLACILAAPPAFAMTIPSGFQVNTVVSGLTLPTTFAFAPDGRIFIAEKSGTVVEVKNGVLQPTPVVTLTDVNDYGDRGLEGLALDPNFAQNGYMYLAYTYENTPGANFSGPKTGRIVRLTVSGDTASLSSKVVLVGTVGGNAAQPSCMDFATTSDCIGSDSNTHSMGALRFGPDGKLYASLGDGAGYLTADPEALGAQDVHWLAGKILRINTDGTGPSDNPFYDGNPNDNQSKVWALGDRNMYRFSFRPSDNKLFIGQVGWATWEAIDIGAKGANYGWPCTEGFATTTYNCTPSSAVSYPIYVFDHHTSTASVIGGAFPTAYPAAYAGNYFFGDYSNDLIKRMVLNPDDSVSAVTDFITGAGGPVDIQVGPDGNLWYAAINVGELRKLAYSTGNQPPSATLSAAPTVGAAPLSVSFSATQSADPDGDTLAYAWDFGDGSQGTGATISHTYANTGSYTATVRVTDSAGQSATAQSIISVGQVPAGAPVPHQITTTIDPSPVVIGHQETVTTTIGNSGDAAPIIVDMEIYDSSVHQVAQQIFENQTIPKGGTSDYTLSWLPPTVGTYTVKIGLFKPGWAGLYEWTDQALSVNVLNRAPASAPSFTASASAAPGPSAGASDAITATVQNAGGDATALVDLEVYQNGAKVGQQFFDNQSFPSGTSHTYTYAYPVPAAGTYTVSVGVFAPAWQSLYTWADQAASFTAVSGAHPLVAYQDALPSGWENWSWGSTQDFADPLAYQGTASLRTTYTAPWGGLFLHSDAPIATGGMQTLSFAVAGDAATLANLQALLVDTSGNPMPAQDLTAYMSGTGTWKTVSIPLAALGAADTQITGIVIQDVSGGSGSSFNLDSLQLQ